MNLVSDFHPANHPYPVLPPPSPNFSHPLHRLFVFRCSPMAYPMFRVRVTLFLLFSDAFLQADQDLPVMPQANRQRRRRTEGMTLMPTHRTMIRRSGRASRR